MRFSMRRFDLLISLYIFCIAVSELMGAKTFPLGTLWGLRFNASVAIFVFPFLFTINDIVTEVHGPARTRSIIRSGLVVVFLLFLFSLLAISLPPSARFLETEAAYDTIFAKSARFSLASLIAFAIAEFTDVFVFVRIRQALAGRALWFRNNASNFVAQLLDTTIFMTLAFWNLANPAGTNVTFLLSLIIPYWLLKCAMSVIETPFVYAGVRWLRKENGEM